MSFLRSILRLQAIMWAVSGLALATFPGAVSESLLDQAPSETAWLRLLGICAVVLAAQMVLVARRLEDLWWWSWSFVILEAGVVLIAVLYAAVGLPDGAASWGWWLLAASGAALGVGDVVGLARTGTERSPV
jgi:hypothetical protein